MKLIKKYAPILVGKKISLQFLFSKDKALNQAFKLFCTPRQGKVHPDQAHFLEEAEDDTVHVDNLKLQTYRWPNEGETILLIHGWESNTHRWKTLILKLHKAGYNVVAFDAPAHGYSSGKILYIPLYQKCLEKIISLYRPNHILAHSVGAMTAIFHQHLHPETEIEKLILLAPPTKLSKIVKGYQETLRLSNKFISHLNSFFQTKFGYTFDEFSMDLFAKSIKTKTLLIHDTEDDIAPYEDVLLIDKSSEHIQLKSTTGYGHSLFFDEVDDMILNFLKAEK